MSCGIGRRRGSDLALLWLLPRPVGTALIQPLAWDPPYAVSAALEEEKKKKKRKERKKGGRKESRKEGRKENREDTRRKKGKRRKHLSGTQKYLPQQ